MEPTTPLQMPSWAWDVALLAIGGIAGVLYAAYRARRTRLVWSAQHLPMAASQDVPGVGHLEVTLNGAPVTNLIVSTVTLDNGYARDFKDLVVRVSMMQGHQIYTEWCTKDGDPKALPWTQDFLGNLQQTIAEHKENKPNAPAFPHWREYRVPSFNRGDRLTLRYLVHAIPPASPACHVVVDEPGVLMTFSRGNEPSVFGVPAFTAAFVGGVVIVPIAWWLTGRPFQTVALVILGVVLSSVGAALVRLYRKLRARIL